MLGCGSDDNNEPGILSGGIKIETVTPVVPNNGPSPTPQPTSATAARSPAVVASAAATSVATSAAATSTATAGNGTGVNAPTTGKWIDVDVTRFQVKLMDGMQVLQTIVPVAVGVQVNSGAYESTQTGLFYVYNKIAGLQYDAPYKASSPTG